MFQYSLVARENESPLANTERVIFPFDKTRVSNTKEQISARTETRADIKRRMTSLIRVTIDGDSLESCRFGVPINNEALTPADIVLGR
ncbi:hypothetical protein J6590_049273 [Homalodisca vitripennis]|nr:hypothetical protein J6590_049273 [Homalodisca vitripennis]